MSDPRESDALHARVRRFVGAGLVGAETERFDALACDLARFQARRVPAVARAFERAGLSPEFIAQAAEIPALPTDVFRLRRVAAHDPAEDLRVFATSGTTASERGHHPLRTLETYRLGALGWAERLLWPDGARLSVVLLAADERRAPSSSLTYMLARFADHHHGDDAEPPGEPRGRWFWDGERLDVAGLVDNLSKLGPGPVLVAGTSFAFVHLCDAHPGRLPLPPGSRVMQTGGFKGRSREVEASALRSAIAATFDLDEAFVVGEYGMTELSSQLYQASLAHALGHGPRPRGPATYLAPPWLSVEAVDPVTLAALPRGTEGIARFVDLANVDSAVAIQTADRVIVDADGGVELLGRLPGAPPRGCSLALEHLVSGHG